MGVSSIINASRRRGVCQQPARQLRRFGVSAFHMTDYECRRGEFAGWDNDRRVAFITNLGAIIKNTVSCGAAGGVVMKDWLAVMPDQFERPDFIAKRGPYPLLFQMCVEQALKTIKLDPSETLACVHDNNRFICGALLEHYQAVLKIEPYSTQLGALTFDRADRIQPLQAADILAYESHKYLRNFLVDGGIREERKLHAMLMKSERIKSFFLTQEGLHAYCDAIRESLSS